MFRIEKAYQLFFKSLKTERRGKVSSPGFKKRRKYMSFTLTLAGYEVLGDGRIRIGDRIYGYHDYRPIRGIIKTLTVKRDPLGDIYIVFSCDGVPLSGPDRIMTGKSAGVDFGLSTYLTLPDGEEVASPRFFKRGIRNIRKATRSLSRKKKGSAITGGQARRVTKSMTAI